MGLFTSKNFASLEDLFIEQIEDLYDAETRLTKAIPKMAEACELRELRDALNKHLRETEVQLQRLEKVFEYMGKEPRREACDGIKGLISEGNEMVSANGDGMVRDAAIIAAAQRVEHYEMAGYGTARAMAEHLGHADAARLLQQTLDEEMNADKKLTEIAEGSIYGKKPNTGQANPTRVKESAKSGSSSGKNGRTARSGSENGRKTKAKAKTTAKSSSGGRSKKAKGRSKSCATSLLVCHWRSLRRQCARAVKLRPRML